MLTTIAKYALYSLIIIHTIGHRKKDWEIKSSFGVKGADHCKFKNKIKKERNPMSSMNPNLFPQVQVQRGKNL